MTDSNSKNAKKTDLTVSHMVESIVGCKWSMGGLDAIDDGVHRPGELQKACVGISTKVLNERLRKLCRFGLIEREAYPEIPPRVEYHMTTRGKKFVPILDAIRQLQDELEDAGS